MKHVTSLTLLTLSFCMERIKKWITNFYTGEMIMKKTIFVVLLVALGGIIFAQRGQSAGMGREMRWQGNNFQAQSPMRPM